MLSYDFTVFHRYIYGKNTGNWAASKTKRKNNGYFFQ
jgi:hypothetical protein